MNKTNGHGARAARDFDVVVWGATGFTGQLVAEYLTRHYGVAKSLKWAIGGRSTSKLEDVRARLVAIDPAAASLPLVVGDARDPASLVKLVQSTRVVVTTVGPYAVHGRELVAACAEHGTDYCDLTGETPFVKETIDLHHGRAKETGARIVNCCGFDSIPSDLGVLMLQAAMREMHGEGCGEIKFVVSSMKGSASGGTIASGINMFEQGAHDPSIRAIMGDPYALDPANGSRGNDGPDQRGVRFDDDLGQWTAPFIMAAINTRIVRRSNALLDYAYGRDFRYSEVMGFGKGPLGCIKATAVAGALGGFVAAMIVPVTRKALQKTVLPAPGEGPTKEERDGGYFKIELVGIGDKTRARLVARVEGTSNPGYGETAKMLSEAGVCLAKDGIDVGGGVLTPASCFGMKLVTRLRRAGMTFDVDTATTARTATTNEPRVHAP